MDHPSYEQVVILLLGALVCGYKIKVGLKTSSVNLMIFYINPEWTFSRDEQKFLYWFTMLFYSIMIIILVYTSLNIAA